MSHFAGSYEGPIASFPSDAAGQAQAVQNAAATSRARPQSRFASVNTFAIPPPHTPFPCPLPPTLKMSFWDGVTAQGEIKALGTPQRPPPLSMPRQSPMPVTSHLCLLS